MSNLQYYSALQDFRRARRRADLERIMAFLKGKSANLLSYRDVYTKLNATKTIKRELKEIPLNAIVGSVNHYDDFTRSFLPKTEHNKERWAAIATIVTGVDGGLPPIEVYQIGDAYFVYDGNHRVSVARQVGATLIEAYVTEIKTKVSISPDIQPDDLILKAEYTKFLASTHLDELRSLKNFQITVPGKYRILEEQIEVYRYFMGLEQQRDIPCDEAVAHWYDTIYLPIVKIIEDQGILRDFPKRTPTDLYVWISEHRSIARQVGITYDEAYVTEIWNKVPAASEKNQTDELIINTEYKEFLKHTHLDRVRPGADLRVTIPGKYRILEEHINVHRYFMGLEQKREISYSEAVMHWYDGVYLPVARVVQEQNILHDFPGRTLTDLYLWISEHRAVARQVDAAHTEVYLPEIWTNVESFPYVHLDDLIIKVEYVDFLIHTRMNELRPKADLTVSTPGKFHTLEEHIDVHRYFMGLEQKREIPYEEAVARWYDTIYVPILKVIVDLRMLRDFPDLTATDLYLWISEHQGDLEKRLGYKIEPVTAANDLVKRFGSRKSSPILSHFGRKILDVVTPGKPEPESVLVQRRKAELAARRNEHLFTEILVPINGRKEGWFVLEQAIEIARREEAHLSGLHVVSSKHLVKSNALLTLKNKFEQRCNAAEVQGELTIETGSIASKIYQYARWADLVVLQLLHPPSSQSIPRLQSEFRAINRRCPSSILALPEKVTPMNHAILAYDSSQKANEALFVSAYLAGCWEMSLVVLTEKVDAHTRSFVKSYLKRHNVITTFLQQRGTLSESLSKVAQEYQSDFIIIGGHRRNPILEIVFGNKVDHVLHESQIPILICR